MATEGSDFNSSSSSSSSSNSSSDSESEVRAKLIGETAKIPWQDLQRFFAGGKALYVAPDVDLIDAAYEIVSDNAKAIEEWTEYGLVGPVTDAQALEWFEAGILVWALVIHPWVLVQPVLQGLNEGHCEE